MLIRMAQPVSRNANLDVLRGIAVLMVLAHHFDLLPGGWAGVDLFFVLSGFLISGLLFNQWKKTGSLNIRRFYIRRAFKIYPAFYALFLVSALLCWSSGSLKTGQSLVAALFIQNYFPVHYVFGHTWSLAVEEHFYLFLPPVLWALSRSRFRLLPLCFALVAVVTLALRLEAGWNFSGDELLIWYAPTHLRIDSLFFGVFLQWLRMFHPERFRKLAAHPLLPVPLMAAILMLILFPLQSPVMHTVGFTVLYLGFGSMLVKMVDGPEITKAFRPLARVGEYSYSIYLWHRIFAMLIPHQGLVMLSLYLASSIGWGILMAAAVEIPALALRDRLFPPGSGRRVRAVAVADSDPGVCGMAPVQIPA
jgi:peptidoglycan/LPS O-acetylase OafA/YrhL